MLDQIIPPEIKNDIFYFMLEHFAANPNLRYFLEIGSSSGVGSTEAFVSSIRKRLDRGEVSLFCMEISTPRYRALIEEYKYDKFVRAYQCSSISIDEFPEWAEVLNFYQKTTTALNSYSIDQIKSWYDEDLQYLKLNNMTFNGINKIKAENNIKFFDMVLIDGSEFTGERDLYAVMGAKFIALDDTNAFKCYNAFRVLSNHSSYRLIHQDLYTRNGFAIFERIY